MHPDFGKTSKSKELRHKFTVRINSAYEKKDLKEINWLINKWNTKYA